MKGETRVSYSYVIWAGAKPSQRELFGSCALGEAKHLLRTYGSNVTVTKHTHKDEEFKL